MLRASFPIPLRHIDTVALEGPQPRPLSNVKDHPTKLLDSIWEADVVSGKAVREWTGFGLSLVAISLSVYSTLHAQSAEATAQRATLAKAEPSLFFAPAVTFATSTLDPHIDRATQKLLNNLNERGVRAAAWPADEKSIGAPFDVRPGHGRPAFVYLLVEVTDGDCASLRSVRVEGLFSDNTNVSRLRENLPTVCPSHGVLVPLFKYTTDDVEPLGTEISGLRLSFQVTTCEVTYVTKTYQIKKKRDCFEAFDYLPTLG